jgi:hypothetical protein
MFEKITRLSSFLFPSSYSIDKIAPSYLATPRGGCVLMEAYYLTWLANSHFENKPISPALEDVGYRDFIRPDKISATVITKTHANTEKTKLILACPNLRKLEGLVVSSLNHTTLRSFYSDAYYTNSTIIGQELSTSLQRVNLEQSPTNDALTILLSLLALHKIKVGSRFKSNIQNNSLIMRSANFGLEDWKTVQGDTSMPW